MQPHSREETVERAALQGEGAAGAQDIARPPLQYVPPNPGSPKMGN